MRCTPRVVKAAHKNNICKIKPNLLYSLFNRKFRSNHTTPPKCLAKSPISRRYELRRGPFISRGKDLLILTCGRLVHRDLPSEGRLLYVTAHEKFEYPSARKLSIRGRCNYVLKRLFANRKIQPRASRRTRRPRTSSSRSAARSTCTPWCSRTPRRPRSSSSPCLPVCEAPMAT